MFRVHNSFYLHSCSMSLVWDLKIVFRKDWIFTQEDEKGIFFQKVKLNFFRLENLELDVLGEKKVTATTTIVDDNQHRTHSSTFYIPLGVTVFIMRLSACFRLISAELKTISLLRSTATETKEQLKQFSKVLW